MHVYAVWCVCCMLLAACCLLHVQPHNFSWLRAQRAVPPLHVTRLVSHSVSADTVQAPILGSTGLGAREVRGTHSPVGVQAALSLKKAENRAMVLQRQELGLKLVPLYGVSYRLDLDLFAVVIKIAGRPRHCGHFDDADAAGHRADEVWTLLGAPQKCNFDADGQVSETTIGLRQAPSPPPQVDLGE